MFLLWHDFNMMWTILKLILTLSLIQKHIFQVGQQKSQNFHRLHRHAIEASVNFGKRMLVVLSHKLWLFVFIRNRFIQKYSSTDSFQRLYTFDLLEKSRWFKLENAKDQNVWCPLAVQRIVKILLWVGHKCEGGSIITEEA